MKRSTQDGRWRNARLLVVVAALVIAAVAGRWGPGARAEAVFRALLPLIVRNHDRQGSYRIGVRQVGGVGEFWDRATGGKFVPRGNNYVRLGPQEDEWGQPLFYHSVFDPGAYNAVQIEAAFARMQEDGYNVVRVFWSQNTIMKAGQFDPAYVANVVDLARRASAHGLYVLFTMDWTPGGKYGEIMGRDCCTRFNGTNLTYLAPSGLEATQAFFVDYIRALLAAGLPKDAVWAWELRNELFFDGDQPPLSLTGGLVTTANGKTYNMASAADKQLMLEEGLVYWIDSLRAAIRALDPTALVTVGFFHPQEPNPSRIGDTRLAVTRPAIWQSQADFIDLHPYPGVELTLAEYVENYGLDNYQAKPVVMGEFGAFTNSYGSEAAAAQALQNWQIESCGYGFDGWLLWTWDTYEQPEIWNGLSGNDAIDYALAPGRRPNPCAAGAFPGQNLALGKPATASRSLGAHPPGLAVDGDIHTHWGAGDYAPQWIQVDLGADKTVGEIRLVVSQYPNGATVHEIYARGTAGPEWGLGTANVNTEDGQVISLVNQSGWTQVRYVRVETTASPSWVSWFEIEVIAK